MRDAGMALTIAVVVSSAPADASREHTFHVIARVPSLCVVDGAFFRLPVSSANAAVGGPSALVDRYRIRCNVPYAASLQAANGRFARRQPLVLLVTANF